MAFGNAYPFFDSDYPTSIARLRISGARPFSAYGEITTVGAASGVLWPTTTPFAFPPPAGVQMAIVSSSANDTAAGTGIRQVRIIYLNASLVEQAEVVTLNGTTPVNTVATNIRFIQCMHAATVGSLGHAAGSVSATNSAILYSYIGTGTARCSSSVRMVPAGKKMIVTSVHAGSVSGTAAAASIIRVASPNFEGSDFTSQGVFMPLAATAYQDNSSGLTIPCPALRGPGQSIGLTYNVDKAATVVGTWFGWLEDL